MRVGLVLHHAGPVDYHFGDGAQLDAALVVGAADHGPAIDDVDALDRADPLMRGAEMLGGDHQPADLRQGGEQGFGRRREAGARQGLRQGRRRVEHEKSLSENSCEAG